MYSSAYIWGRIISHLEKQLTVPVVSSFLDDAEIVEVSDTMIVLSTPSEYRKDMILSRFTPYIREAMKELFDKDVELQVLNDTEVGSYNSTRKQEEPFMFNPMFTFARFVVGSSNRFAHATAYAVANRTTDKYNPLVIYGPSGLGKTHLLYAIAGEIHRRDPKAKIVYIRSDQFTNELVEAIREGKNVEFRSKYRNADLLLMDDIQFIGGKESTQEEFFHTFNALYEANKQIVLTSDRPVHEIAKLEERIRTRCEWGMVADIQPPDYDTRVAIIKNKAYSLGIEMADDVCSYIAENITANVRQLEGTVKKIMAYQDLTGASIDVPSVARAIKDMYTAGKSDALPTAGLILTEVCKFYHIDESVLRSTRRDKRTAEARQIGMYLIREMTNLSFPEIGSELGLDHTTVMYGHKKILSKLDDTSNGLAENIRDIMSEINNKL
ncbi:MAG: chromosomal replication initiator protein DnaA [Oscillospiraceae bacterium]|nr:chromosomal replication initiator protein DnaA [Oscillospiraceae bacterium]